MITIHNFARGQRGVRVSWVCEEMGLAYRTETVSYPPSDAYRALNALGSVPFLEDDGGVAINESVAMMLYLAERYGPTPLLPAKDDPALARVLQLTIFGEAGLAAVINPLIKARVEAAIGFVAKALDGKPYLAGDAFTLADISVGTALDMWTGALGKTIPEALLAWRAHVQGRPAYQRARSVQGAKA